MESLFLFASIVTFMMQYYIDGRKFEIFNPKNLFQIYFIIQLPFVLVIGLSSDFPGFNWLSPGTSKSEILKLGWLFWGAHLVFVSSYYLFGKRWISLPFFKESRWRYKRVKVICFILFICGYLLFLYLMQLNGGYTEFIANREAWRAGGMIGQGYLIFPATSMISLAAIAYLITSPSIFRGKIGLVKLIILIVVTIIPASQLGFRGMMLMPVIQLMFVYHYRVSKLKINIVLPLLILLGFAFTVYGGYREVTPNINENIDANTVFKILSERPEFLYTIFVRSKGADVVASVIEQLARVGEYKLFIEILYEAVTIPIPSVIWPGKPVPLSVQFSEQFFGISGGVSPTVIGEAYWHGGVFGVLITMAVLGFAFRLYRNILFREVKKDATFFFLASIFPSLILMAEAIQGNINGIFVYLIFTMLFTILFSTSLNFIKIKIK